MKRKDIKVGDIVNSPANYRKDTGIKIGLHKAVIVGDNDDTTMDVRLITHDSRGSNVPIDFDKLRGNHNIDKTSFITTAPIKGVIKLFRRIRGGCRYEE